MIELLIRGVWQKRCFLGSMETRCRQRCWEGGKGRSFCEHSVRSAWQNNRALSSGSRHELDSGLDCNHAGASQGDFTGVNDPIENGAVVVPDTLAESRKQESEQAE